MKIESSKIPLLPQVSTFYNALLLGHVTVREEEAVLSSPPSSRHREDLGEARGEARPSMILCCHATNKARAGPVAF